MSHSPTGMFSGAWGQFTQGLQTSGPKPPCLAEYFHHWAMNPVDLIMALPKLPPKLLPHLLLMWTWIDVPPQHLEWKEKTGTCWSSPPL